MFNNIRASPFLYQPLCNYTCTMFSTLISDHQDQHLNLTYAGVIFVQWDALSDMWVHKYVHTTLHKKTCFQNHSGLSECGAIPLMALPWSCFSIYAAHRKAAAPLLSQLNLPPAPSQSFRGFAVPLWPADAQFSLMVFRIASWLPQFPSM